MSDQPPKHKTDREYAIAVIQKQAGVDADAAASLLRKLAQRGKHVVERLVDAGRQGLLAEVRELLAGVAKPADAPSGDPPPAA